MMFKCVKCGTAWTSMGLPICPICGTAVPKSPEVSESGRHARVPAPRPQVAQPPQPILSAALSLPPQLGTYVPQMSVTPDKPTSSIRPVQPVRKEPMPPPPAPKVDPPAVADQPKKAISPAPAVPILKDVTPVPPPPAPKAAPPAIADKPNRSISRAPAVPMLKDFTPLEEIPIRPPQDPTPPRSVPKVDHAATALSDFGLDQITIPEPAVPVPAPRGEDDSWYCSLPAIEPAPRPPRPILKKHLPVRPLLEPPTASPAITELVDASVLVDRHRPQTVAARKLPAPARPLTIPLVLGVFAILAGVAPPVAAALANNRFGVLGFCISGLLLPLAPLAWMAGLAAEQRRREQGLRVERRVLVGRLLGQWGTVLLAAEGTIALLLIAALRLAAR